MGGEACVKSLKTDRVRLRRRTSPQEGGGISSHPPALNDSDHAWLLGRIGSPEYVFMCDVTGGL